MMFKKAFHAGIVSGATTVTYRSWKRPQVKLGNRYNIYPIGEVELTDLRVVDAVADADIACTGFASREALIPMLQSGPEYTLYRVEFRFTGPVVREVTRLQEEVPGSDDLAVLGRSLASKDARRGQPWTQSVLEAIRAGPGVSSEVLAGRFDVPRLKFKQDVAKLKALGLTISLETGYKLSKRGAAYLDWVQAGPH